MAEANAAKKAAEEKKLKAEAAAAKKAKDEAAARAVQAKKLKDEADAEAAAVKKAADAKALKAAQRALIKEGTLKLTCQHAKITVNTDMSGKMDPYVKITQSDANKKVVSSVRTAAHMSGHQSPKWNETFEFNITDYNLPIDFAIFEKDTFSDDHIGDGQFTPKQFSTPQSTKEFQRCYLNNKEVAQVYFKAVWTPKE